MTNEEFQSWLAGIGRLTEAQRDQAAGALLSPATGIPTAADPEAAEGESSHFEERASLGSDSRVDRRIEVRWNAGYETAKPRLVELMRSILPITDPFQMERANETIAAVESLPFVGEHRGSLTITDQQFERGADFVYCLSVGEYGFQLSHWERMNIGGGQSDFTPERMLVNCRPVNETPTEVEDEDLEALEFMREGIEGFIGTRMSDEDWQWQVNLARESDSSVVPNGINNWLESIPIDKEEDPPATVRIQWGV